MRSSVMSRVPLMAACMAVGLVGQANAAWVQDFSTVSDGTLLQDVAGWTKNSGSDAIVTSNSGLPGMALALPSNGNGTNSYTRSLGETEKATAADGGVSFSFVYKIDSTSYTLFAAEFGQSGAGGNHYGISFGSGDLAVTNGTYTQTPWGTRDENRASVGSYSADTWYRLDITGINLSNTAQGADLPAASLSLYALDASGNVAGTVISNAPVKAAGFDGIAFGSIDYVTVTGPWYTGGHTMSATDFAIAAVPEPISLSAFGVAAVGLLARRRRLA